MSVLGHLLGGKAVSTIGSQAYNFEQLVNRSRYCDCKPMARAPDSPAILTRPDVGAISEREDPVRELLV